MDEPLSQIFPYYHMLSTDGSPSPTYSESPSLADESPSQMDGLFTPTDESPSPLLKSRIPRKTIIYDKLEFFAYVSKFEHHLDTIVHLADPQTTENLEYTTFIVLFERELFVIAETMRYSSTTSIPPENMRLIHMPLIDRVVYNSLCLQATNHCPETSITDFTKNFFCSHQTQSDPTICKVLGKDSFRVLPTPINPRNPP